MALKSPEANHVLARKTDTEFDLCRIEMGLLFTYFDADNATIASLQQCVEKGFSLCERYPQLDKNQRVKVLLSLRQLVYRAQRKRAHNELYRARGTILIQEIEKKLTHAIELQSLGMLKAIES